MALSWYPFYPGDYSRDTAHLSIIEHGAYRLLLDHYYSSGGPLPANAQQLHRICRAFADAEQAAIATVLSQFFTLEDDGYHHHRADTEIAKGAAISEKRAQAARSRGAKRPQATSPDQASGEQMQSNCKANAQQLVTQPQPQPQPQLQPTTTNPKHQGHRPGGLELPEWLPRENWAAFVETRKRIKAPLTDRAMVLSIGELEKLRAQGHDPAAVLDQSVMNGWKGLFPIKGAAGQARAPANANGLRPEFGSMNHQEKIPDWLQGQDQQEVTKQ